MSDSYIRELQEREFEDYLVQQKNGYAFSESFIDWESRVLIADALVRGDWQVAFPNQLKSTEKPMVQNLAEVMSRDVPRLVADSEPSLRSVVKGEGKEADKKAYLREAIALSYWSENRGNILIPLWTIDLIVTGAAFGICYVDDDSDYPIFDRIDPRFCFPDIVNGRLQSLLVCRRIKLRQAMDLYPAINFVGSTKMELSRAEVDVIDYYDSEKVVHAVSVVHEKNQIAASDTFIVRADHHELECPPVAFAQLPTHDGAFRGLLDQVGPSLLAKNKIARLMTQYAEQQVTAPIIEKGLLNIVAKPGPNTIFHLDPTVPDAQMGRLQPAGGSPNLFALMSILDTEQRGGIGYPAARQGEVSQSIASASFVGASQGQLTGMVRECLRYLADMRQHINFVCYKLDIEYKDFSKPLTVAAKSNKGMYKPSSAIDNIYTTKVIYGASAGLDRLSADARLIQLYSAGIITARTARENLEFVEDPENEANVWEREQAQKALLQKFLTDPNVPFDLISSVVAKQEEGLSFGEAVAAAQQETAAKQEQAVQQQQAAQPVPGVPGQPGPPGQGTPGQLPEGAVEKGGIPPQVAGGQEVQFNPPPLAQVIVRGK